MKLVLIVLIHSIVLLPALAISADYPITMPHTQGTSTRNFKIGIQTIAAQGSFAQQRTLTSGSSIQTIGALLGASVTGSWAGKLFAQGPEVGYEEFSIYNMPQNGDSTGPASGPGFELPIHWIIPHHIKAVASRPHSSQVTVFPSNTAKASLASTSEDGVFEVRDTGELVLDLTRDPYHAFIRITGLQPGLNEAIQQWGIHNVQMIIEYTVPRQERFDTLSVRLIPDKYIRPGLRTFLEVYLQSNHSEENFRKMRGFIDELIKKGYAFVDTFRGKPFLRPAVQFQGFDNRFKEWAKNKLQLDENQLNAIAQEMYNLQTGPVVIFTDIMKYRNGGQLAMPLTKVLASPENKTHNQGWGISPADLSTKIGLDMFFGGRVRADPFPDLTSVATRGDKYKGSGWITMIAPDRNQQGAQLVIKKISFSPIEETPAGGRQG